LFILDNKYFNGTLLFSYLKRWFQPEAIGPANEFAPLLDELRNAQREWGYANQYFNLVSDPDLVDLAIYNIGVTEKKYLYLLKKARESGACAERYSYQ
jgi:hypothetical protein